MNIILGASGQVGSAIVEQLVSAGAPVTGVVRDAAKADALRNKGAAAAVAWNASLRSGRSSLSPLYQ